MEAMVATIARFNSSALADGFSHGFAFALASKRSTLHKPKVQCRVRSELHTLQNNN